MTESLNRLLDALAQPVLEPTSRTFWPWLLCAVAVALVVTRSHRAEGMRAWLSAALAPHLWRHPSARADLWLLIARRLFVLLGWLPETTLALAFGIALSRTLDQVFGIPQGWVAPPWLLGLVYTVTLFVIWDASRYVIHRLMHQIPALWAFHQVHHSAEVLTPLSFHRIHPVESAIYTLRGIVVSGSLGAVFFWLFRGAASPWTILGAHAFGMVLNAATGNLRHSHVWLSFGPRVERWLISPAQHQLHHSTVVEQTNSNYGTWLAVWDRLGGTLQLAERPPVRFGLDEADLNHDPHDLGSLLLRPVVASMRAVPRGVAWVGLLLWTPPGMAQEAEEAPESEEPVETAYEVIVEAQDGVPRVTGSAYTMDDTQLERFEYTSIDELITMVPGVYVRTEEGLGLRPNIGMRGGNADRSARVALMEDGVLFGPAPYAAPAAYYFPMVSRVTAVEVFKGPSAIRHGPQTVGGALNLVTRDVPRSGPAAEVDVGLGEWKTGKAHSWVGVGDTHKGLLIEGAHLGTGGFKVVDGGGPTSVSRQDLMVKGRLGTARTTEAHQGVEVKLGYSHENSYETYLGLTSDDFEQDPMRRYAASDGDHMQWHRTQAEVAWDARVSRRVDVRTVGYHHYLDRQWFKLNRFEDGPDLHDLLLNPPDSGQGALFLGILRGEVDSTTPDQALLRGTNARSFHSFGVQSMARIRMPGDSGLYNELEIGVRLHGDRVARVHTERPYNMVSGQMVSAGALDTTLDSRTSANALALYAHDEIAFGRFEIHPGLRTEVVQTAAGTGATGPTDPITRATVLPGGGVLVDPIDRLQLFGGVHRGFSPVPPGASEETRPEVAWSYEAGLRATPMDTRMELVGFYSDYTNLTGQCTFSSGCDEDQLDKQFDGGAATIYGLEALAMQPVRLPGRLTLSGEVSYTLTQAWFRTAFSSEFPQFGRVEVGDSLPYVPTHQGNAQLALDHPRFGLAFSGSGRTELRDEAGQEEVPAAQQIPGIATFDASASVKLAERATLYATATNLFDAVAVASWRPFGARPNPPRQVMVGLRARL